MSSEFERRRRLLASEFHQRKLDGFIVSAAPNVRYLSGFTGSNAALLMTAGGEAALFTDPRYQFQAARETGCKVRVARGPLLPRLMALARRKNLRRLGFEKGRLAYEAYESLSEGLWLGASLKPVAGLVESLRMVKSALEIGLIRRSARTLCATFEQVIRHACPGMLERELAAELDYRMRRLGADQPAFETIVTSGERTALPHARPSAHRLAAGQLLLIDMGASQDGYASDMTRMAFLGSPGRRLKQLYAAVAEAQLAALDAVRPGISTGAVDRAARNALRARKLDRAFLHSTGHGLGLEIHEPPRLGKGEKTRLAAGMVITIEPGAYLEGFGGVRIEDTVVVTPGGCDILTSTPKELLLL